MELAVVALAEMPAVAPAALVLSVRSMDVWLTRLPRVRRTSCAPVAVPVKAIVRRAVPRADRISPEPDTLLVHRQSSHFVSRAIDRPQIAAADLALRENAHGRYVAAVRRAPISMFPSRPVRCVARLPRPSRACSLMFSGWIAFQATNLVVGAARRMTLCRVPIASSPSAAC